jgi:phospholipid/cholesterol/gamma-HCH transport system substrate-binding protein/paraquat-inducible protein B
VQEVEDSATKLLADVNDVLAENRESISGTLSGVDKIIEDAQPIVERVADLSGKIEELADSLQGTLDNAQSLTDHAGGIMADNRPAIEEIVLDLRETVRNLKTFSRTMAEQPQAVIRGKSPEGRK